MDGSNKSVPDDGRDDDISSKSGEYGGEFAALVPLPPAVFIVVIGFVMELSAAFGVIEGERVQVFRLLIFALGLLGMLGMAIMHACNTLTNDDGFGKKVSFTRSGIYVLGSGAMIFQAIALYGTSVGFETCPDYQFFAVELCALMVTGMQVFILIKFQEIRINKNALATLFSRCVLAHLVAVNLCLWLMTIIEESMHENSDHSDDSDHANDTSISSSVFGNETTCVTEEQLVEIIIPYTYPLLIEFCVLAGGLHITTWERCGLKTPPEERVPVVGNHPVENGDGGAVPFVRRDSVNRMVQHRNNGVGVLLGWLFILSTIVFVIVCLYNSYVHSKYTRNFGMAIYGYNLALNIVLALCVMGAWWGTRSLKSSRPHVEDEESHQEKRDHTILIITFVALACYKVFSMIAAVLEAQVIILVDGIFAMLGGLALTVFINYYIPRKSLAYPEQRASKPGRQSLEFMRCINFPLWLVNTFLLKATFAKKPMEDTYGELEWAIISNIVQPLTILFHFHAMMCISDVIAHLHTWHGEPLEKKEGDGSSSPSIAPNDNSTDNAGFTL